MNLSSLSGQSCFSAETRGWDMLGVNVFFMLGPGPWNMYLNLHASSIINSYLILSMYTILPGDYHCCQRWCQKWFRWFQHSLTSPHEPTHPAFDRSWSLLIWRISPNLCKLPPRERLGLHPRSSKLLQCLLHLQLPSARVWLKIAAERDDHPNLPSAAMYIRLP